MTKLIVLAVLVTLQFLLLYLNIKSRHEGKAY